MVKLQKINDLLEKSNGFFLDRIVWTLYYPGKFLPLKDDFHTWRKRKHTAIDYKVLTKGKDLIIQKILEEYPGIPQNIFSFFVKLKDNLSCRFTFNGNLWFMKKHKLLDETNIINYRREFNMIDFSHENCKNKQLNFGGHKNCMIFNYQLSELLKKIKDSYRIYSQTLSQIVDKPEEYIPTYQPKITISTMEICQDFSTHSLEWHPFRDWCLENGRTTISFDSLTHYNQYRILSKERKKLYTEFMREKELKDIKKSINWGFKTSNKGNQIHFYQKLINQSRWELQANRDLYINHLFRLVFDKAITKSEFIGSLIDYWNSHHKLISFFGDYELKNRHSIVNDFSQKYNLKIGELHSLIRATSFKELSDYEGKSIELVKLMKKRNKKLSQMLLIEYDRSLRMYVPGLNLLDLREKYLTPDLPSEIINSKLKEARKEFDLRMEQQLSEIVDEIISGNQEDLKEREKIFQEEQYERYKRLYL